MWARIEPLLGDLGITRVAHLTHLDDVGLPVHMAMRPAGRVLSSGSGKGTTELGSMIGACMEAIEQVAWEDARPAVRVEPEDGLRRSGESYVPMSDLPRRRHDLANPSIPSAWMQVLDLTSAEPVWVPVETTCVSAEPGTLRFNRPMSSSNGLASGARVIDAALSGLYEVVERDAIACASTAPPSVAPGRGDGPLGDALDTIERADVGIRLHDLTSDVGLPTVRAIIEGPDGVASSFVGYGTSVDPEQAAIRAVTEAAQSRCIVIAGARDDIFDLERRAAARFRTPLPDDEAVAPMPAARSTGTTAGDLTHAIDRIRSAGFDRILVHRYTTDADPVQVVRVIVPGLEGYPGPHTQPGPRALAAAGAWA